MPKLTVSPFLLRFLSFSLLLGLLTAHFEPPAPVVAGVTAANDTPLIRLQYAQFDPLVNSPALPSGFGAVALSDQPRLALVQFKGPILPAWRTDLTRLGATIYAYVPDWTFLVRLTQTQAEQITRLPSVRWVGPYQPAYKLPPSLTVRPGLQDLTLHLTEDTLVSSVEAEIGRAGGKILARPTTPARAVSTRFLTGLKPLRVQADAANLGRLVALDSVVWIEPASHPRPLNDVAAWIMQSGQPGQYPVWGQSITGAGSSPSASDVVGTEQIVAVDDTGVYLAHQDFGSGVYPNANVLGITNWAIEAGHSEVVTGTDNFGGNGHGTHVAGTIAGSGAASSGQYKGMAFGARIYVQQTGPGLEYLQGISPAPADPLTHLMTEALQKGARLQNNSWGDGSSSGRIYGDYSVQADSFMWDHPDFLGLWAAGNSEGGDPRIYEPGTAKNIVTVGASYNNSTDLDKLASFSSRGPTADGRIKPDVIAPGACLTSVRSNTTNGYFVDCGTSMATPVVSGAAALVRDWYINTLGYPTPQAALVKATLINSAQYMTSVGGNLPDPGQGWGRIQLSSVITTGRQTAYTDDTSGLDTGEEAVFVYRVTDNTQPFKLSLVWTDPPGAPMVSRELVNDLDLSVTAPDGTTLYQGNNFQGQYSVTGGSRDALNNVEGVTVASPTPGLWTVRVRGFNVPVGPQPFGLVAGGALDCNLPVGLVTDTTDSVQTNCSRSLRQALAVAPSNGTIDFSRLPTGATFYPLAPLPTLPVGLNLQAPCPAGQPTVRLDGRYLQLSIWHDPALNWPPGSQNVNLIGLAVGNFPRQSLDLGNGTYNLRCSWLGTFDGQTPAPNGLGLQIKAGIHVQIGPGVKIVQ